MTDFKKSLKIVDKTLSSLKPMYANLYSDLTRATDEIDDLEHAIELVKANAVQRCFLENELKKARKIRRECKDAMSLIWMTGEPARCSLKSFVWKLGVIHRKSVMIFLFKE